MRIDFGSSLINLDERHIRWASVIKFLHFFPFWFKTNRLVLCVHGIHFSFLLQLILWRPLCVSNNSSGSGLPFIVTVIHLTLNVEIFVHITLRLFLPPLPRLRTSRLSTIREESLTTNCLEDCNPFFSPVTKLREHFPCLWFRCPVRFFLQLLTK